MSDAASSRPNVYKAILTVEQLGSILEEIETSGSNVSLQIKGAARLQAEARPMAVSDVRQALLEQRSVQVRYHVNGTIWSDTYIATSEGIQLVRCELPADLY
jgi:hypothetical protein